jgi:hypothetical protein
MTQEIEDGDTLAHKAIELAHHLLFEQKMFSQQHVKDVIHLLEGVLKKYSTSRFMSSESSTLICLSPYTELHLRWFLSWILHLYVEIKTESLLRTAIEHLQKAVNYYINYIFFFWRKFTPFLDHPK